MRDPVRDGRSRQTRVDAVPRRERRTLDIVRPPLLHLDGVPATLVVVQPPGKQIETYPRDQWMAGVVRSFGDRQCPPEAVARLVPTALLRQECAEVVRDQADLGMVAGEQLLLEPQRP